MVRIGRTIAQPMVRTKISRRAPGSDTVLLMNLADAEDSHQTKGLLRLTMACNERCPFCNVPAEDYRPTLTPPWEMVAEQLEAFVASGQKTLTISGGEPTLLRRRLLRLIGEAQDAGVPFVELQTNAILIDAPYAAALAEKGLTSAFVSLLSDVPALHDELAGLEGAYHRCLRGIDAMLDAGIRVTLNPVLARQTEGRLVDFISFVARRLPRVRSISLSAVQPHGRAANTPELMPDYAVLGPQVPVARRAAADHGIELLNPYCGLPLCIGWSEGLDNCVEAIEARAGGWQARPGIDNQGDKSHGAPCAPCALRAWCGGAWHAYWQHRGGSGIQAPAVVVAPWRAGARTHLLQTVVRAPAGPSEETWSSIAAAQTPAVWLWTGRLDRSAIERLRTSRCTDVGLEVPASGMAAGGARARGMARLLRVLVRAGPRIRLAVRSGRHSHDDLRTLATLAATLGVVGVDVLPG